MERQRHVCLTRRRGEPRQWEGKPWLWLGSEDGLIPLPRNFSTLPLLTHTPLKSLALPELPDNVRFMKSLRFTDQPLQTWFTLPHTNPPFRRYGAIVREYSDGWVDVCVDYKIYNVKKEWLELDLPNRFASCERISN